MNQRLHEMIGDYYREIDKINKKAIKQKKVVNKTGLERIKIIKFNIRNICATLQKGLWL